MRKLILITIPAAALLVALWGRPAASGATDTSSPDTKALTERIETLEKLVVKDPYHPKNTVLARLETLESTVKEMAKTGEKNARVEGKDDQQTKRAVEALQKSVADFEKRLKSVEAAKPPAALADNAADIKDMKRTLDQLNRSLEDVKQRLGRLEAKR